MPIKLGRKTFKSQKEAERSLKKSRPDIKDASAYIASVEKTIAKRRTAKSKKRK